jgi:hypothetical protein
MAERGPATNFPFTRNDLKKAAENATPFREFDEEGLVGQGGPMGIWGVVE